MVDLKKYRNDRLTIEGRKDLIKSIMGQVFDKRKTKLDAQTIELEAELYTASMPDGFNDLVTKNPYWFDTASKLELKEDTGVDVFSCQFSTNRPIPNYMFRGSSYNLRVFKKDLPLRLWNKAKRHADDLGKYKRDRAALISELQGIFNSVSTVRRLIETWPEVTKYHNFALAGAVNSGMPVVVNTTINQHLAEAKKG